MKRLYIKSKFQRRGIGAALCIALMEQRAGIKTVWLNREKEENQNDIKPDYEINSINELEYILDDLEKS